jgi:hypothetical protein
VSSSYDRYLRRLRDPRWIPHIGSYCDVRCHRCAFSTRCWTFATLHGLEPATEEDVEPAEPECEPQTPPRLGWAETHDVEIDSPMTPAEEKEYDARADRIDHDDLNTDAQSYLSDVHEILKPLLRDCADDSSDTTLSDLPHLSDVSDFSNLAEAIHDVYSWSLTIAAKCHRAISSLEFAKDEEPNNDPVQNDANVRRRLCSSLLNNRRQRGARLLRLECWIRGW